MDRSQIEKELAAVEADILEAENRLPAHSTKPSTMQMLLELEDRRDELLAALRDLDTSAAENGTADG